LDPLFRADDSAVSVVELEPQALWEKVADDAGWRYQANDFLFDRVASLPQAKLLHGVGHPIGGTVQDPIAHIPLLREAVDRLDPAWVSEHLSFNRVQRRGEVEHAGFLLPPPQSPAAVRIAAQRIAELRRALDRPIAFETGVNYLRPVNGAMTDGDFFGAVADAAGSGIVLDLHNLWCNERNGRQSVAAALDCIPLDRVWEIHLAGGMEMSGFWLDAHSGAVPAEVVEIAASVIPRLSNLGALMFEVLPEHLPQIGLDGVQRQLESLQPLWRLRPPRTIKVAALPGSSPCTSADVAEVALWEIALVDAVRAEPSSTPASKALQGDPGCALLRELVADFRRANLARTLHYTMTALLAGLGTQGTCELLESYFNTHAPDPFAAIEADRFADFLHMHLQRFARVRYLDEILAFEHALIRATVHRVSSEIAWSADPTMLFEALDAGLLPPPLPAVCSTMRICPS
ncbi:MAG: DUF692 domain-containing protein, partial [Pseudomonadota bacterium]|nr:DUF692 domain-containing protein [Pseudomonadota bacterium]